MRQQQQSIHLSKNNQQYGGKAFARGDDNNQRGKVSANGEPSRAQQQSICLRGKAKATPAAKHPAE
jgi:hypothetical protein